MQGTQPEDMRMAKPHDNVNRHTDMRMGTHIRVITHI